MLHHSGFPVGLCFSWIGRRSPGRSTVAIALVASLGTSLVLPACQSAPTVDNRANAVVARLEQIADTRQRAAASAMVLNGLCSLARVAGGKVDGALEHSLVPFFNGLDAGVKARVERVGNVLGAIPATKRTALLGPLAAHDPGACTAAPNWDAIRAAVIFALQQPPRLRTNFCAGGFNYGDGTSGARAITMASRILLTGIEGGPDVPAPEGSPVILGVEGEHVLARHPALAATANNGDGMSPYGVATGIPCNDAGGCDSSLGMVCSTRFGNTPGQCFAFPVVQKDQELILRGYNYWDVEAARLVLTPVFPGEGSESTAIVTAVDPNEPSDAALACLVASPANPTHNRAHFRIAANQGAFYKLHLYNHNGTFRTQRDGIDQADPRVLHVCYPPSDHAQALPPGTIRDCTKPVETCPQDGAPCVAHWTTSPRKIENCRHLPSEPVVCGETPEWFIDQHLTQRTDGAGASPDDPIVFVIKDEPTYELRTTLAAIECRDETSFTNWFGSDEAVLGVFGFPMPPPPNIVQELQHSLDDNAQAWHGDMDADDRKHPGKLLATVPGVRADSQVFYVIELIEDDSRLADFIAGALLIIAAAVVIYYTAGAALWTTALGTAGSLAIWGAIANDLGEDDLIGMSSALVTPLSMDERIGASHAPDFLVHPPAVSVLPAAPNLGPDHERSQRLIHPFAEVPFSPPLAAQCNPGACVQAGQQCLVNRCVDPGFVDPTANLGFKERREFYGSDGYYAIDLLWEKVKTGP